MRWLGVAVGLFLGTTLGVVVGAIFSEPIRRIAMRPPPTPAVNLAAFDALNRAATATEQSLGVGINFQGLSERVQALATELSLASSSAHTDQERRMIAEYAQAIDDYRASLDVWNRSIQRNDDDNVWLSPDTIQKYQIPKEWSVTGTAIYDSTRVNQRIWIAASGHLQAARSIATAVGIPSARP